MSELHLLESGERVQPLGEGRRFTLTVPFPRLSGTSGLPELVLTVIMSMNRDTQRETLTVRRFNEYYTLMAVYQELTAAISSKMSDTAYLVVDGLTIQQLVSVYRYARIGILRSICMYHGIPTFNMKLDSIRDAACRHVCTERCVQPILLFKSSPRPRPYVEDRFVSALVGVRPMVDVATIYGPDSPREQAPDEVPGVDMEFDCSHLLPLGEVLKSEIISEWQSSFAPANVQTGVCAVCAGRVSNKALHYVHASTIDLSLLTNDELPVRVRPRDYDMNAYGNAILHARGLRDRDALGVMSICEGCKKDLRVGRMPKLALCNWLYYGRLSLPDDVSRAFQESSVFERVLIARARSTVLSCRFGIESPESTTGGAHVDKRGQGFRHTMKGMRGNVVVTPLDVVRVNQHLPPPPELVRDTLCIIFTGMDQEVTADTLEDLHPVLVRKTRVQRLIRFLLEYNPHYARVDGFRGFSSEYLNALFGGADDQGVPDRVEIARIEETEAIKATTSDYVPVRGIVMPPDTVAADTLLMENVGYTLCDRTPAAYEEMKMTAVEKCLSRNPYLHLRKGDCFVPDFHNPYILSWLLPHLDPWGIGGFYHPRRKRYVSMEEQVSHMLRMDDESFVKDPEFAFIFYNVMRKKNVTQGVRFSVPMYRHRRVVDDILKIDRVQLVQLASKFKAAPLYRPIGESEVHIMNVLRSVNMTTQGVPGSAAQKIAMRNKIRGLIVAYGAPTMFITLNPSDRDSILVQAMMSDDPHIGDTLNGMPLGDWQRRLLAVRNPAVCALVFDAVMKGFIDIILRYGRDQPGLYGHCDAYYGTVEAQGRGTLHCHILIWLRGHPPPMVLRERLKSSPLYTSKLVSWLESVMQSDFLTEDGPRAGAEAWNRRMERELRGITGNPHPGSIVGPLIRDLKGEAFWDQFYMHVNQLLVEYNIHEHKATCWKYLARGEKRTDSKCRMGMTGQVFPSTIIDPESQAITVRRTHPKMTYFTDLLTFLLKCNTDVKFVGSGFDANAFIYYVTDYITKPALSMHVGLSALSYAITRIAQKHGEEVTESSSLPDGTLTSAMTIAVNSMMGHQEISHQQVMSYLVGGGDHYTSHKYQAFNWGSLLSYVEVYWSAMDAEPQGRRETVTLSVSASGMAISSQRLDYVYRPESPVYSSLCLYDFIATVDKGLLRRKLRVEGTDTGRALTGERFSSVDHPQWETHGLHLRRRPWIPVLLGPSILRSSTGEGGDSEKRAMQIVVLFKPWRVVSELKGHRQTWVEALEELVIRLSDRQKVVIANLDTLARSKEDRDRHGKSRRSKRLEGPQDTLTVADLVDDGLNSGLSLPVLDDISHGPAEDAPASFSALPQLVGPGCTRDIDSCYSGHALQAMDVVMKDGPHISECAREGEDVDEHIRQVASMRLNHIAPAAENSARGGGRVVSVNDPRGPEASVEQLDDRVQSSVPTLVVGGSGTGGSSVIDWRWKHAYTVIEESHLRDNPEQCRSFSIVARHIIEGGDQLLMYIGGMGGTGKSHVVKCIVKLLECLGRRRELLIGAPTGIAAVLLEVGAATLHSLIMTGATRRASVTQRLTEMWRPVRYLIVDEISMVGASFLATLSNRIQLAKGDDPLGSGRLFGGVNVICLGDFCQLKPVSQHPLFASALVSSPSFAQVKNNQSLDSLSGVYIWRQFRVVVQLKKNQRQKDDPVYSAVLSNIRLKSWAVPIQDRRWTEAMYMEYLQSRLLCRVARDSPEELESFRDAPVIVGLKVLRDALNARLSHYHSVRLGVTPYVYCSVDTVSGTLAPNSIRRLLWGLPSSKCADLFGKLTLFVGMKVMIMENIAISNGIVNGAEGVIVDIHSHVDSYGFRVADAVYVRVPKSQVGLPGLDPDVVVLGPTTVSIAFNFSECLPGVSVQSFRRRQIPIVPAYSYTDYKSQGRSLKACVVDLTTSHGQGIYMMLSRVKTLTGLIIMRWFPPSQIFQRPSQELREELSRLAVLEEETRCRFPDILSTVDRLFRPISEAGSDDVPMDDGDAPPDT